MTKKEETKQEDMKQEVEEKVVMTADSKQSVKTGPRIYIGPSLRGVLTGTVYKSGLTPALEAAAEKIPAISELIVPLENLTKANRELSEPDSALRRIYQMAETYKRGE